MHAFSSGLVFRFEFMVHRACVSWTVDSQFRFSLQEEGAKPVFHLARGPGHSAVVPVIHLLIPPASTECLSQARLHARCREVKRWQSRLGLHILTSLFPRRVSAENTRQDTHRLRPGPQGDHAGPPEMLSGRSSLSSAPVSCPHSRKGCKEQPPGACNFGQSADS